MPLLFDWLMNAVERGSTGNNAGRALVYHDTYLSYRGLLHRVDRRSRELQSFGVRKGDWVGLLLGNDPEWVVLTLALSKLEAVPVPLDPTLGSRDLELTLVAAPLRALITRPNAMDPLSNPSGTLRMDRTTQPPRMVPESRHRLSGTLLSCLFFGPTGSAPPALPTPEIVLLTLDAGGDPKSVLRDSSTLTGIATSLQGTLGINPDSRILCSAPLYDCQGFDLGFIAALSQGAALYLDDGGPGHRLVKLLGDQAINLFASTPREFAALTRVTNARPLPEATTLFISSGPTLPTPIVQAVHRRFGVTIHACYQSSEAGPMTLDRAEGLPESMGLPFAGVDVAVRDAGLAPLPPGKVGAIWVRGPGIAARFLPTLPKRGSGTPIGRTASDGWLRTGDLGLLDQKGHLFLRGREDDLVKIDRRPVSLGEVESCLERIDSVRAATAHVEYDDAGSARIIVSIIPGKKCRPKQLLDHCTRQLAPHKVPTRIEMSKSEEPIP